MHALASSRNDEAHTLAKVQWLEVVTAGQSGTGVTQWLHHHFLHAGQKTSIEGILSEAGFTGFSAFFLRPDCPRNHLFQPRAAPTSGIVSGLSQAGEARQPRD